VQRLVSLKPFLVPSAHRAGSPPVAFRPCAIGLPGGGTATQCRRDGNAISRRRSKRLNAFYDRVAPAYDGWLRHYERWMKIGESRQRLASAARGRTLEVGVGSGLNLVHYPSDVKLTAVDASPAMLALAHRRAAAVGMSVDLRLGDGQHLEFEDGSFDTVMATLFLSAVPDHRRALAEIRRVLRPGGRLLVLDHVQSDRRAVRWAQAALDPLLVGYAGWHLRRNFTEALTALGFTIDAQRRLRLGMVVELVGSRRPQPADGVA
jgi:ubiquinone/menaquinone biosynthesis C-methylase UbiE